MYKWPQGRVIRTIALILALLVAGDLAWNGASGELNVYFDGAEAGKLKHLILGLFHVALALGVLITAVVLVGFRQQTVDFLIEVEQEMQKVEWPKGNVLMRATSVIAIAVVVLSVLILGVDAVAQPLIYTWLPDLVGWLGGHS